MLVALGLLASLVPQVTYVSASSGKPSDQILVAWPGWGVQQDLGPITGVVGTFHVWVSAEPGGDRVTVWASLVDASTREVLRQTSINAAPDAVAVRSKLDFPSYAVPSGQRLLLQLQVADFEKNYVIYKLADSNLGLMRVAVNGLPDVADAPLAFAHTINGSGLRTAILGDQSARVRLVLAGSIAVFALLVHPQFGPGLRRGGLRVRRRLRKATRTVASFVRAVDRPAGEQSTSGFDRVLHIPWYPWPIAAVPILHFLTQNSLHFAVADSIVPLAFALSYAIGSMAVLRLVLGDWHRSALVTAVVLMIFFGYGHISHAVDDRIDERVVFASAAVVTGTLIVLIVRAAGAVPRWTRFLNVLSTILLTLSVVSLAVNILDSIQRDHPSDVASSGIVAHLLPGGIPEVSSSRPDIYYIILDEYTRDDGLGGFDNSEFISELESRGFYVASQGMSNYDSSLKSIPSSLNMSYLDDLGEWSPESDADLVNLSRYNALAAILKRIGYTYIHLESGHAVTNEAPLADHLVEFRRSGTQVLEDGRQAASSDSEVFPRKFSCELARTTLLWPAFNRCFLAEDDTILEWWSPIRALRMFEFLSSPSGIRSPVFVFAHIVKPHPPTTFDRYGNYVSGNSVYDQFGDGHDASVPSAYVGQLIYINSLVLDMVDSIIRNSDTDPVIVLAGDHGRHHDGQFGHFVFAAFHLPAGGSASVYPSISSVNHFRAILNYYFGLGVALVDDRVG